MWIDDVGLDGDYIRDDDAKDDAGGYDDGTRRTSKYWKNARIRFIESEVGQ